eukprot:TRINITY_DN2051_c0_g1_i5.p1 TRINITY_DN2051_c0_g1~~TRINITY_DN2051_c0_g1_i5.p1  ORF type:complete len:521 (+),score=75.98 TRINITY_DN2051_c0_g1_i5:466-2028(+)
MTLTVKNWPYGLLSSKLRLKFDAEMSSPISNVSLDSLQAQAQMFKLYTSQYRFVVNSALLAENDGNLASVLVGLLSGVVDLLLGLVGALGDILGLLLGTMKASMYYEFPQGDILVYDPDYGLLFDNCQSDCSGHGFCDDYGRCQCESFWSGTDCSKAVCPDDCSGNGECDGTGQTPFCRCTVQGWTGSNCNTPVCPGNGCSSHGRCVGNAGRSPTCQCDPGWRGSACNIADCPGEPDCSSHGNCNVDLTCTCDKGWSGQNCSVPMCPGTPACSRHGNCLTTVSPPECQCSVGFAGTDCSVAFQCISDSDCGNGNCSQNGTCVCQRDFTGSDCRIALCPGFDAVKSTANCNNRGRCVSDVSPHVCDCKEGWGGPDCSLVSCPGNNCTGNGDCITDSFPPSCSCSFGWDGKACDEKIVFVENIPPETKPGMPFSYYVLGAIIAGSIAFIGIVIGFVMVHRRRRFLRKREKRSLAMLNNGTPVPSSSNSNFQDVKSSSSFFSNRGSFFKSTNNLMGEQKVGSS